MMHAIFKTRLWPVVWPALLLLGATLAVAQGTSNTSPQNGQDAPAEAGETIPQQNGKPLPLKPDLPGLHRNHRLILKDGSYQLVREYQIIGDRVKYFSEERSDWEEMPVSLVDWDATRRWEQAHAATDDENAPGMAEAAEVDKEEAEIREQENSRTPLVAPGLDLPDQSGAFVLDTYHGTPELVQLPATDMSLNRRQKHGLGVLDPMAGETASMEIQGKHSRIHLHVNDPAIYLSLAAADDNQPVLGPAMTVNTSTSKAVNGPQGAQSAQSTFVIVKVEERNTLRIVGAVHVNRDGSVAQDDDVIAAKGHVLPGKHWLLIKPAQPLDIGEYALVEILSPTEISPTVWDFRVDPTKGDNLDAITPILKPVDAR